MNELKRISCLFLIAFSLCTSNNVFAADIEDNSFLIEEAYNQEPHVVQHINTFFYNWDDNIWDYSFTQEWPLLSQDHQLSYTVPVLHSDESGTDIGDIALNYRYQALDTEQIAASPRFSISLPTGDEEEGFGLGAVGFEVAAPISLKLSKTLISHWNLGLNVTPDAESSLGTSKTVSGHFFGASLVHLTSENFNLLLELFGSSNEAVDEDAREEELLINPGFRFALNFNNLQIVPGLSFPIGIGPSEGEYGAFFYVSFEHGY